MTETAGGQARLTKIEVKGLFGTYDHVIEHHREARVTVIHGVNGVGKTTIFRMLAAASAGDWDVFLRVPFDRFEVTLDDGVVFVVRTCPGTEELMRGLHIDLITPDGEARRSLLRIDAADLSLALEHIASATGLIAKISGQNAWLDGTTREALAPLEAWARYSDKVSADDRPTILKRRDSDDTFWDMGDFSVLGYTEEPPPPLLPLPVVLVDDARLSRLAVHEHRVMGARAYAIDTVRDIAATVSSVMQQALASYGWEADRADDFLPRLLLQGGDPDANVPDVRELIQMLIKERDRLARIGLLPASRLRKLDLGIIAHLDRLRLGILERHLWAEMLKLDQLRGIATPLELLLDAANQRFKDKALRMDPQHGLVIERGGVRVDLGRLSTGEQHMLVLLGRMLFAVPRGGLLLVDEPELSQHMGWQRRFLPDQIRFAEALGYDAIVATQSAYVAGARPELLVDLGEDAA